MMVLSFQTSNNSFVWAKRGLLRVSELSKGDEILGLDGGGNPSYQKIVSARKTDYNRVIRVVSHRNESSVYERQRVVKLGGPSEIRFLRKGEDKLELCLKPTFFVEIKNSLESRPCELSSRMAYLLGRTKKARHEATLRGKMIFPLNVWLRLKLLASIFHEALLEYRINPRDRIYWGSGKSSMFKFRLVVKSPKMISILNEIDSYPNLIPVKIRLSSLNCLRAYLTGLVESIGTSCDTGFQISTKRTQDELRRFLYNMFPLFGIAPQKTKWSYNVSIQTESDILEKIGKGDISQRVRRFYLLRKADTFRYKSVWEFRTTGLNWSPAIDLLLLEK